ncbi:MAG: PadR family transcriptional regulator [Clostridiales bacterium]|nr:PadR family transcriptional regulator [Clostridiales bacterium]
MSDDRQDFVQGLVAELRRGTITIGVLSQLTNPKYGYALVESLTAKGIPIEPGTLYPLLRRLEKQEVLTSEWETTGAKPRKYYVLSETGKQIYRQMCKEWADMNDNLKQLIEEAGFNERGGNDGKR